MATKDVAACVAELRPRYQVAGRAEKTALLTRLCEVTGYHRKAAIRLLAAPSGRRAASSRGRGRPKRYDTRVHTAVVRLWEASGRLASKNLAPYLPILMEQLERHGELRLVDNADGRARGERGHTLDRLLRPHCQQLGRRPRHAPTGRAIRTAQAAMRS